MTIKHYFSVAIWIALLQGTADAGDSERFQQKCTRFCGSETRQHKDFDHYIRKIEDHPQITELLEKSTSFKELSSGELGLPNPQIMVGIENMPISDPAFDRFLPTSKTLGIKQDIPSYTLRKAKSERQVSLSEQQRLIADYTRQRLEAMLIIQLSELDKVHKLQALSKRQLDYYDALESELRGRLEAGDAVYSRFALLDVERAEIESRLNDLNSERLIIESELVSLVDEVPQVNLPPIIQTIWTEDADALYPVLISAHNILVVQKDVKIADAQFEPSYGIQAVYKQRESGRNYSGDDWFGIQATVSLPFWSETNQEPKRRAAEATKRSAEAAYADMRRDWVRQMSVLQAEREATRRNIGLLKQKIASLKQMAEAANRNYEAGSGTLDPVLEAQINELKIASQLASLESKLTRITVEFNSYILGGNGHDNRN